MRGWAWLAAIFALLATPGHAVGNQSLVLNTSSGIWAVSENALGQMIEGLLRAVDLTAPVPELARELAELWPTAIAQVQGPLYALDDETPAAPAESPATLASAGRAPR